MIDRSVLPQRSLALPAPKPGPSTTEDDSLFVSDDENEIPAPSVTVGSEISESTVHSEKPPIFAPSPFGSFPQTKVNEFPAVRTQQPAPSQPAEPNKPFLSLFSGGYGKASAAPSMSAMTAVSAPAAPNPFASASSPSASAMPATTAPAPNPFARGSSPFAPLKTETTQAQAPGPFSLSSPSSEKQNSIFHTTRNPFAAASQSANKPAAPSTTPQIKFPSFQAPAPSSFNFSATSTSEQTNAFPSTSQPTAPTPSPLNISTTSTSNEQTSGVATGQPPKSLFDAAKPPSFSGSTSSLFNFSQTAPREPSTQEPQTSVSKPAQETPSLFEPKENGKTKQKQFDSLAIHCSLTI